MGQDIRKPGDDAAENDARAGERAEEAASTPLPGNGDAETPRGEVNGAPVDLGSHNPDPNAHNWLHPEADLETWDGVFHATEETAEPVLGGHGEPDDAGGKDGGNAGGKDEGKDAVEVPSGPVPEATAPEATAPYDFPGHDASLDSPHEPPPPILDTRTRQRAIIGAIVVAVLALMGVGIWLLVSMLSTQSAPTATAPPVTGSTESAAPLPREIKALDYRLGDCFADFDSESSQAMAVACNTGHSAQLVAVHTYAPQDAYPGREALKTKAQDSCKAAKLNVKSNEYTLKFQLVYPSPTSWDKGDRRVDCFVVVDTGNSIMDDLLQR